VGTSNKDESSSEMRNGSKIIELRHEREPI